MKDCTSTKRPFNKNFLIDKFFNLVHIDVNKKKLMKDRTQRKKPS